MDPTGSNQGVTVIMDDQEQQMDAQGQWYVLQTLTGQELKAKESMEKRLELEELTEAIHDTIVPMERITEVKVGKKTTTNRKLFPGYILMNLNLYDEEKKIDGRVWSFIKDTPGIIGFIGGNKPSPLSRTEVDDIMEQLEHGEEAAKPRIEYELNEMVKIKDGPFENLEGKIENIDPDRGKLKVLVSIFGRNTPVELEYWQVTRVD